MPIVNFRTSDLNSIFNNQPAPRTDGRIYRRVRVKLLMLDAARSLEDLRTRGNALEALKGDREGQFSIRVNGQWRICFRWADGQPLDLELVDYH